MRPIDVFKFNFIRLFSILTLLSIIFNIKAQETTDSVKVKTLEELVVKSERAWIEGDKAVFIPSKSEKNLAYDPITLLQNMNIPTLVSDGNGLRSINGSPVSIFINGEPAEDVDINTFWPKQAKRVEYMENPSDPRFRGARVVVNFIMPKYVVGGVTRLIGIQTIPNFGKYNLSSKLEYKKWTFGALVDAGYTRDHRTNYSGEDEYLDLWYNGEHHDKISNHLEGKNYVRNNNFNVSLNVRHTTPKHAITHSIGFRGNINPGSGSLNSDFWNPDLFSSNSSFSRNNLKSYSPQIRGNYFFQLSNIWSLVFGWNYNLSRNKSVSVYELNGNSPIDNNVEETLNSTAISISPFVRVGKTVTLAMDLKTSMNWYDISYGGSTNLNQNQWRGETDAIFKFYWYPNNKFSISLMPELLTTYWKVGDLKRTTSVDPLISASLYWAPTRKFSMSLYPVVRAVRASAADAGDVMIRQSELIWLKGNPNLKTGTVMNPSINFTWLPANFLSTSASISYNHQTNMIISIYEPATKDREGLIKRYENAAPLDRLYLDANLNFRFLNNRFNVNLQPTFNRDIQHGQYGRTLSWFRMRGSMGYSINNCRLAVVYGGPEKWLSEGGIEQNWKADDWSFTFSYGNGNLNFSASIEDIFHDRMKMKRDIMAGNFQSHKISYATGRSLRLVLTYIFGYGKKVNQSIDVYTPTEVKSGALGTSEK